ncbi:hypothetical protein MVEN_02384400 [Mycena venus]|uniref:Uncharacterized protein n=1 Tax=Mycena venus TaxID=2733690 RepID=A0A8H6X2T8_9AGAR|nr:hypothetical protein MVEN_02384400 [Mycena venus]
MSSSEQHLVVLINDVTLGVSIPGVVLSIPLLTAIAYLLWNPVSRPHLNRVSFRLLIYAIAANLVLGSVMIPDMQETTLGCSFVAFLSVASPLLSASMFCCIALNLQSALSSPVLCAYFHRSFRLVLLYGVNGKTMEKYYMGGAFLLCIACTIPPLAAGELGWYVTNGVCWLRDPTPAIQLHWLLATQSVPMLTMSAIEVYSVVRIIIFMVQHEMEIQQLRANTTSQSTGISDSGIGTVASRRPKHPIVEFRSMIIRIALYPVLSCFLSITPCILDVYSIMDPDLTDLPLDLRILDVFIFCLRPLLYALLSATDPSLIRAVRSLNLKVLSRCTDESEDVRADSYELSGVRFATKSGRNTLVPYATSASGDPEQQDSPAVLVDPGRIVELRPDRIAHQL